MTSASARPGMSVASHPAYRGQTAAKRLARVSRTATSIMANANMGAFSRLSVTRTRHVTLARTSALATRVFILAEANAFRTAPFCRAE